MSGAIFFEHPAVREAPPDVLRDLRRLDPTFELAYLGNGKWLPFVRRPNDDRQMDARRELQAMYRRIPAALATLPPEKRARMREVYALKEVKLRRFAAGYQHLNEIFEGDPDGRIARWYERVLYRSNRIRSESQAEAMQQARSEKPEEGGAIDRLFADEDRAKDAWKDFALNRHTVTVHNNPLARGAA